MILEDGRIDLKLIQSLQSFKSEVRIWHSEGRDKIEVCPMTAIISLMCQRKTIKMEPNLSYPELVRLGTEGGVITNEEQQGNQRPIYFTILNHVHHFFKFDMANKSILSDSFLSRACTQSLCRENSILIMTRLERAS